MRIPTLTWILIGIIVQSQALPLLNHLPDSELSAGSLDNNDESQLFSGYEHNNGADLFSLAKLSVLHAWWFQIIVTLSMCIAFLLCAYLFSCVLRKEETIETEVEMVLLESTPAEVPMRDDKKIAKRRAEALSNNPASSNEEEPSQPAKKIKSDEVLYSRGVTMTEDGRTYHPYKKYYDRTRQAEYEELLMKHFKTLPAFDDWGFGKKFQTQSSGLSDIAQNEQPTNHASIESAATSQMFETSAGSKEKCSKKSNLWYFMNGLPMSSAQIIKPMDALVQNVGNGQGQLIKSNGRKVIGASKSMNDLVYFPTATELMKAISEFTALSNSSPNLSSTHSNNSKLSNQEMEEIRDNLMTSDHNVTSSSFFEYDGEKPQKTENLRARFAQFKLEAEAASQSESLGLGMGADPHATNEEQ